MLDESDAPSNADKAAEERVFLAFSLRPSVDGTVYLASLFHLHAFKLRIPNHHDTFPHKLDPERFVNRVFPSHDIQFDASKNAIGHAVDNDLP